MPQRIRHHLSTDAVAIFLCVEVHHFEMKDRNVGLRDTAARGLAFHDEGTAPAVRGTIDLVRTPDADTNPKSVWLPGPWRLRKAGPMQQTGHGAFP